MLLYIDACVRGDSRTRRLADHLVGALGAPCERLRLADCRFPVVDEAFLAKRDRLLREEKFDDPMFDFARGFAAADGIVIAAPYWDLSFPAMLKAYLEQVNALGITFRYTPQGVPVGLCRASRLTYVTTAGGAFVPEAYGFGYVRALAQSFYGIEDVQLICASGLDIEGADVEGILQDCERDIDRRFGRPAE